MIAIEFVFALMRVTVPSRLFATQTAPSWYAMPAGPFPTWIGWMTLPLAGSMRTTSFAPRWLAHSDPAPKASSVAGIESVADGLPVSGLILVIVPSPLFATHTEPCP